MSYTSVTTGWLDFLTGGTSLTPGNVYMALLAPVSVSGGLAVMDVGTESGDAYAGGAGAYTLATLPVTASALHAASWNTLGSLTGKPGHDFALRVDYRDDTSWGTSAEQFDLTITTTPEPGSIALLGTGLIALVGAGCLKRKRQG